MRLTSNVKPEALPENQVKLPTLKDRRLYATWSTVAALPVEYRWSYAAFAAWAVTLPGWDEARISRTKGRLMLRESGGVYTWINGNAKRASPKYDLVWTNPHE